MRVFTWVIFLVCVPSLAADEPLPVETIDARLRQAMSLARETNRTALVGELIQTRDMVTRSIERKDFALIERLLRDAERKVGLDAGGLTMQGLPVARLTYRENKQLRELRDRLTLAMQQGDPAATDPVIGEMTKLLGARAGLPDLRRKGENPKVMPIMPADLAGLFVRILDAEKNRLAPFVAGKPPTGLLARDAASIAAGCLAMRPIIARHQPARIESLDQLIAGCCEIMIALQTDKGFFKFPDLRGKQIHFGEMIESIAEQSVTNLDSGWVVVPLPEGASFVDAGECGMALLRAGAEFKKPAWTAAGRKAADWTLAAHPSVNHHENAFVVSLLAETHRRTSDARFREAALRWWKLGLAPGMAANGRWLDGENARTSNLMIILRAMNDLAEILPAGADREAIITGARKTLTEILIEADKLGVPASPFVVRELGRARSWADPGEKRLAARLEQAGTLAHLKCIQNGVRAATPFPELAALADIWK